jgi:hypothetical protein
MGKYLFIPKNILFFCIYQPIGFFVFFENCLVFLQLFYLLKEYGYYRNIKK